MKLQVLICTYGPRLGRIALNDLPQVEGVGYLVSWQNPDGLPVPDGFGRSDVELLSFADHGLARNRNHALEATTAPLAMICDDDVSLSAEGLRMLIARFEAQPQADIIIFRSEPPGSRVYPPDGRDLGRPWPHHHPMSIEIAFRTDSLHSAGIRFNMLAGIGAPVLVAGEEDLLLRDARRRGLGIRFANICVATHPADTTAERLSADPAFVMTKGAIIAATRGPLTALTRYPVEAHRADMPYGRALRALMQGFFYALKHRL